MCVRVCGGISKPWSTEGRHREAVTVMQYWLFINHPPPFSFFLPFFPSSLNLCDTTPIFYFFLLLIARRPTGCPSISPANLSPRYDNLFSASGTLTTLAGGCYYKGVTTNSANSQCHDCTADRCSLQNMTRNFPPAG